MGFGNMQKLMKQAQKMQADMQKLQEDMKNMMVTGTAGGGMVEAVCNCRQEMQSIKINPEAVDPEDVEMLEDMVLAAVSEALRLSQEKAAAEMQKITGGMNLPGGLGF